MQSDDVFRSHLHATTAAIEQWLGGLVAGIEVASDKATWRVDLRPRAPHACLVELILRIDQCFDLTVGTETYEDRAIENLALFPKLLHAIVAGRVITRSSSSAVTGAVHRIETLVALADDTTWFGTRQVLPVSTSSNVDLIHRDRHYVPYTRAV